ncbi:endonuclease NucS [Anaerolineales bacterium HSG6]|nr:endonuclease NucS [Anaerolineales bacterium HSG6]
MSTEIKTWEIMGGELISINSSLSENDRKEKDHLEKWIKTKPQILGNDILIIGEQVYTKSGPLDFLGIDNSGNLVIVELKREKLARVVLAQAIDYASDLANWDIEKISETCMSYTGDSLEDYLIANFENIQIDDLTINQSQRILLVGFSIEESLSRMIEWLSNGFDMAINAIILSYSKTSNGAELLSRTVTIPEEKSKEKSNKKKFKIEMSDTPGEYEAERLTELLRGYFKKANYSSNRIKNVLLPALLKKELLTRNQLKKAFVKAGEANDESQAGYFIALISSQLGHAKKDYLRQIIEYEYPDNSWTKDNFRLRVGTKELVEKLLNELKQ